MATRKPTGAERPIEAALTRLLTLAGRGAPPDRMAREVEAIVADWRLGAGEEPGELREQVEELREQLAAGVAAAEEQAAEIDLGEPGAARQAGRLLASLAAMRDAAQRALVRL